MNGYQYEAVFSNTAGTSAAARHVDRGRRADGHRQPRSGERSSTRAASGTFMAAASGNPTPSVQWEVNTGSGYTDVTNAPITGAELQRRDHGTLTITGATATMNGYQYEAVFTNLAGAATEYAGRAHGRLRPCSRPATSRSPRAGRLVHGGQFPQPRYGAVGSEHGQRLQSGVQRRRV